MQRFGRALARFTGWAYVTLLLGLLALAVVMLVLNAILGIGT